MRSLLAQHIEAMARRLKTDEFAPQLSRMEELTITELAVLHGTLSERLRPSNPTAIALIDHTRIYSIPWVRNLLIALVLALIVVSGMYLMGLVSERSTLNILTLKGIALGWYLMAFTLLGGAGAIVSILIRVIPALYKATCEPNHYYDSYILTLFTGMVAGVMLACLIPLDVQTLDEARGLGQLGVAFLAGMGGSTLVRPINHVMNLLESRLDRLTRRVSQ